MVIPEGEHKIEFKFEPKVIETGSKITLASSAIMFILLVGGIYLGFRKKERSEEISK
jgi:LPXTG-motif cell wall-anchored protein